jgi:class 3 adenylate cyclase
VKRLHLEVRAAIHTGECEVHGTDLAGIAIHVAARIVALAGPSEIFVSQTVRDLAPPVQGFISRRAGSRSSKASKVSTTSSLWRTERALVDAGPGVAPSR